MENEFKLIKIKILEEERIEELFAHMECQNIAPKGNRFEAQLPTKFNSSNPRAVQCYLNENLSCRVRNMGFSQGDIFSLVSFIVFDCCTESDQNKNLPAAKRWICKKLGYSEFISSTSLQIKEDPLKWLKDVKKNRNKNKINNTYENKILPDEVLNQYVIYPFLPYINEGIEYKTQIEFQIGFDIQSERVIFPIHNQFGDIVSVKGRTIDPLYKEKGIYKFIYLYNFNKMIELYNWHLAVYYVLEKKEIIIFEGEKSCWLATQFGYRNCVAISGDDLSDYQVQMIKGLGLDIRIIIALDKDKTADDFKKQATKFKHTRQVYAMWDGNTKLLSEDLKHSPTDLGKEVFDQLYEESYRHRIYA